MLPAGGLGACWLGQLELHPVVRCDSHFTFATYQMATGNQLDKEFMKYIKHQRQQQQLVEHARPVVTLYIANEQLNL